MEQRQSCALISGSSMGLGLAFARECATRGMDLFLVALPKSGLPEAGASIAKDFGVSVDWLEGDLTESATIDSIAALIKSKKLQIDLLINNAGIGDVSPFMNYPLKHYEDTINLNITALVRLTRLVVGEFGSRPHCRVLNVASLGSFFPMPTLAIYSASKRFVFDFSLALRAELSGRVAVSVLCPNAFVTTSAVDEYTEQFGLVSRLACLPTDKIARIALDGIARGKAVIIPGRFNRFLGALSRFVPRALVMRVICHYWGGFCKEPESVASEARDLTAAGSI